MLPFLINFGGMPSLGTVSESVFILGKLSSFSPMSNLQPDKLEHPE